MSNLRQGTPSKGRRVNRTSPLYALLVLLAAALAIGLVIGFIVGRVTAPKAPPIDPPPVVDDVQTDVDESDASGEESLAEPEPEKEPEPVVAEPTGIVVCIDAGHGGNDGGTSDGDRLEKNDNLQLAQVVKQELEAKGIEVIMTRDEDVYVSLDRRCEIANSSGADYLVSLHRNSAGGVANGVEVWRSYRADDEAIFFAEKVHDGLLSAGVTRDRGVRIGSQSSENSDLQMNRETDMASVLIELGFIEIDEDNELFDTKQAEYGQAIAQAVLDTYAEFHK